MKKSLFICAASILIISLLNGCAFKDSGTQEQQPTETVTNSSSPVTVPSQSSSEAPIASSAKSSDASVGPAVVKSDSYTYKSQYIEVSIELPEVSGLSDGSIEAKVNEILDGLMQKAKAEVPQAELESKGLYESGLTPPAPYMTTISYSVEYNQKGLLSILVSDYRYLGGAHGGTVRTSYTFDLRTGTLLSLADLVKKGSGYREFINAAIRTEIDERVKTGEVYELVQFKDIGDNAAYYLTQDAIILYFQEYEYFPYVSGIQEFRIDYQQLAGMLKSDFQL